MDENADGVGLLGGITVYHLRILCESPWNGGCGYTPEQVGQMTLDQIMFRLCDKELLKNPLGRRTVKTASEGVAGVIKPDEDGRVKARTTDGKTIFLKTTGKSKVQMIKERNEKLKASQKKRKKKRK